MDTKTYKTKFANAATVKKEWVVIDGEGQVVGRLASKAAQIIRGKLKPDFSPHVDCGDNVIIINAEKVRFTGNKLTEKKYIRHSGYPGGQKETTPKQLFEKIPTRIMENAVRGMLPKNRLGRALFNNLYVYAGPEHPHAAQQPKEIKL